MISLTDNFNSAATKISNNSNNNNIMRIVQQIVYTIRIYQIYQPVCKIIKHKFINFVNDQESKITMTHNQRGQHKFINSLLLNIVGCALDRSFDRWAVEVCILPVFEEKYALRIISYL